MEFFFIFPEKLHLGQFGKSDYTIQTNLDDAFTWMAEGVVPSYGSLYCSILVIS